MVVAFGARRNANTNGGDASRVGALRQRLTDRHVISAVCEPLFMAFSRRETRLLKNAPTRDASPPLELAFGGSAWWQHLVLEETQTLMGATRLASGH